MAAAVQTNLSVAFTHGAQLTMDHCGALIHGAAILWSRLLSQLPQETLLLCAPASQPLTPFRWELVNTTGSARAGDTVATLFVSMLGILVPDVIEPGFYLSLQSCLRLGCSPEEFAQYLAVFWLTCTYELTCIQACVNALKHTRTHAAAADRFCKVGVERVGGSLVLECMRACQCAYFQ